MKRNYTYIEMLCSMLKVKDMIIRTCRMESIYIKKSLFAILILGLNIWFMPESFARINSNKLFDNFILKAETKSVMITSTIPPSDSIIFLNYLFSKMAGEIKVELIQKTIVAGKLRMDIQKGAITHVDDLIVTQYDKNRQELSRIIYPNPLNEEIEYVNENGELNHTKLSLDSNTLDIRLPLIEGATYIGIDRVISTKSATKVNLITIEL